MPSDLRTVWEFLGLEPDERFVLSAIFRKESDGPVLTAASLLAGPEAITHTGWPGWRQAEGFHPPPRAETLEVPASFAHELDDATVTRITLSQTDAYTWLRSTLEQQVSPAMAGLPEAAAPLAAATAPSG